ncbi:MAG: TonB-dependent receptor, partial [Methylococcaceae bacterium]|nr:TonB-dependent receptor [Methylococcaceae bacterium]
MYQIHRTPCALHNLSIAIALALPPLASSLPAMAADKGAENTAIPQSVSHHFDIPAQALPDALNAFIAATDWQVGFPAGLGKDVRSNAVNGIFTPGQALNKLLQGTGLLYRLNGDNSVTLEKMAVMEPQSSSSLPAVTVTGQRRYDPTDPYNKDYSVPNTTFATKTDTPIMETPLNIQVVPKAVLDDQQAIKLDKSVKLVSGVTTGQGTGGLSDQITIRGFFNFNYFRNGMRIDTDGGADGTRAMANVQSIEVLKGPAAMLYGQVEPGGMVNVVTKKPLDTAYYSLQQQFGSFDFYRTSIDATGPVADNKDLLYRMNVSYENSGSFRELVDYEKVFVAPVLQWNISPQTQVMLEMEYRHENNDYDLHSRPLIIDGKRADGSWINPRLADIPRERNLMERNPNPVEDKFIGLNVSHKFNDDWAITEQLGIDLLDRERTAMLPQALRADQRTLDRQLLTSDFYTRNNYYTMTNLTGHFDTWGLKHTLLIGGDFYRQDRNTVGYSSTVKSP